MYPKECPNCNTPWEDDQNIYDFFKAKYQEEHPDKSTEAIKALANNTAFKYGCTKENPKHFGKNVVGVEYQGHYDGVSEWYCQVCKCYVDRFTGDISNAN